LLAEIPLEHHQWARLLQALAEKRMMGFCFEGAAFAMNSQGVFAANSPDYR